MTIVCTTSLKQVDLEDNPLLGHSHSNRVEMCCRHCWWTLRYVYKVTLQVPQTYRLYALYAKCRV